MAATSAVYARIDSNLKNRAESVLSQLGISPSAAIQMLYSQIALTQSFPLDLRLPMKPPVCVEGMSQSALDAEIQKGVESARTESLFSIDEVDTMLAREFGI